MNVVADLPNPLNPALALFEPRWIPWQVDIHLRAQPLQVESFASRIRRADETYISILNRGFDLFARGCTAVGPALNEGCRTASIECHRLIGEC